jgi:hypothetical protein
LSMCDKAPPSLGLYPTIIIRVCFPPFFVNG